MRGHLFFCGEDGAKQYCVRIAGKKWHITVTTTGSNKHASATEGCDKSCVIEEKIPEEIIERVKRFVKRAMNPRSRARAQLRAHKL